MCRKTLTKTEGLIRNEEGKGREEGREGEEKEEEEEETPLNQRKSEEQSLSAGTMES